MMIVLTLLISLMQPAARVEGTEAALRSAEDVALVRVATATRVDGERAFTRVERVAVIDGSPPLKAEVVQTGPRLHRLEQGTLVIMPLERDGERWTYRAASRSAMTVDPRAQAQAVAFARRWRRREPRAPEDAVGAWINLLKHPAEVARRIGHESLVAHGPRLRATLTDAQLARLMLPLTMAGIPEADHLARVRMIGVLGGQRGAARLAEVFAQLASDRVRRMAVGVMSRAPHADAKAVMRRCAIEATGSLKMRCARVMQRIDGPSGP